MKLTGEFFSLQLYWFPRAVVIEQHKLCGLKQENFNVSKFWSLEVNTVSSFWRLWGKIYPMPPFLASGDSQQSFLQMHHYNICLPHMTFSLCVSSPLFSYKDTRHVKLGSTLVTSSLLLLLLNCFSRVRLCDPIDGSPTGSPVPEILQARTLEWAAMSFSWESFRRRDQTLTSCNGRRILYHWAPWEAETSTWP